MTQPVKELNGGGTGISTGGPKKQASTGWQAAPPPPQSASLVQAVWVSALMHALAVLLAPFELAPPVSRDERAATPDVHVAAKTQDKRAFGYTVVGYALSIAGTVVSTPELRKTMFRLITGGLGPLLGGFTVPADALAVGRLAVSGVEVDGRLPLAGS